MVSIIIDNYNYGHFLRHAIESALNQTYRPVEVIVVDDGSADNSIEVMRGYGEKILPITKTNGGQASAFNAGFAASVGEIVIFLDADDVLHPTAAETVVPYFNDTRIARVQWPLQVINENGTELNAVSSAKLSSGDVREQVLTGGPYGYDWAPTSGNAWARRFLQAIFPLPESDFTNYADNYLSALCPLYGRIAVCDTQSCWRNHGSNETRTQSVFDDRLAAWVRRFDVCLEATKWHCDVLGLDFDPDTWKSNSWFHRIERGIKTIESAIPEGEPFVLIDEAKWAVDGFAAGRPCLPFPQRNGMYWGLPPDDDAAIAELERACEQGVRHIVCAWPAFWWLDHYQKFSESLASRFRRIVSNDDLVIYRSERGNNC